MVSPAPRSIKMFNAFAREMVLIAKKHCSASHKASLKKRFKLFDASSPKHARDFIARKQQVGDKDKDKEEGVVRVFDGISSDDIVGVVPTETKPLVKALVAGMVVASTLVEDEASDEIVSRVANAIANRDAGRVEDCVMDEDLTREIHAATADDANLPTRLIDDLNAVGCFSVVGAGASPRGGEGETSPIGIVGLAEEISRELDLSSLMGNVGASGGGGGGEAGLASIIESINRKVKSRIQDESVDATRLCSEAHAILGKMPPM